MEQDLVERQKRSRSPGTEGLPSVALPTTVTPEVDPTSKLLAETRKKEMSINLKESMVNLVVGGAPLTSASTAPIVGAGGGVVGEIKWLITDFTVRELSDSSTQPEPLVLTNMSVPENCKAPGTGQPDGAVALEGLSLEKILTAFTPLLESAPPAPLVSEAPAGEENKDEAAKEDEPIALAVDEDLKKLFEFAQVATKGTTHIFGRLFGTKEGRTAIHKEVRATLGLHFDSSTVADGKNDRIKITFVGAKGEKAFAQRNRRGLGWPADRGQYLHFTAYKENIDSSSMLRTLASKLSIAQKGIEFSGTKDKRGVTLQRLCIHKGECERVAGLNNFSGFGRNSVVKLGNFEYKDTGLRLGTLNGNFFSIVIRRLDEVVAMEDGSCVSRPMSAEAAAAHGAKMAAALTHHGFINYFGPQRFGTTSVATSTVGCALLAKKYKDVVMMCLQSKSELAPEVKQAIILGEQGQWAEALASLPHFCYQERDMLNILAKNPNDFAAAISAIPRPVTMLFCHSVQSLAWNEMASRRIRINPRHPVAGDLVLLTKDPAVTSGCDEDAEPKDEDSKTSLPAVHTVTPEEATNRTFTLNQVVLTVPGPDSQLQFPTGAVMAEAQIDKASYQTYLAGIGASILLDSAKEDDAFTKKFHFHGTYRKLVAMPLQPHGVQVKVKRVSTVASPCVDTDLMKLNRENPPTGGNKRERKKERKINESVEHKNEECSEETDAVPHSTPVAVVSANNAFEEPPEGEGLAVLEVSFALGAGCYATSLLREMVNLVRST